MKGVLSGGVKRVGFKPLPFDPEEGAGTAEEKKQEDPSDVQKPTALSPKEASTPTTVCSPASSMASVSPSNKSPRNVRKMFRLPRYFRYRRKGSTSQSCTSSQGEHSEDEELAQAGEADDPVMAVFQSRYKNRVRWALDDQPVAEQYTPSPQKKDVKEERKETTDSSGALDSALNTSTNSSTSTSSTKNSNIKKFVKGALFGGGSSKSGDKEFQQEVAKEVEAEKDLIWESNNDSPDGGEVLYTSHRKPSNQSEQAQLTISFTENPKTRAAVLKLIKKARRAQLVYYRYDYAVKYFVRALDLLTAEKYPDHHPTVRKTLDGLNDAHHKLSNYNNSANIVKIGIKYEDSGELIRALKMYSIAYRIRRDNLSRTHPSLVVLLNMLGSIQAKRGEFEEAMQIYELALKDPPNESATSDSSDTPVSTPTAAASAGNTTDDGSEEAAPPPPPPQTPSYDHFSTKGNLLAKSVTYREMGSIFEKGDRREEALKMYHLSLDCVCEWKLAAGVSSAEKGLKCGLGSNSKGLDDSMTSEEAEESPKKATGALSVFMDKVQLKKSVNNQGETEDEQTMEKGEMEMMVDIHDMETADVNAFLGTVCYYDSFFPPHLETINAQKGRSTASAAAMANGDSEGLDSRDDYADIDVALTIHAIAQLLRKQGEFSQALEAYAVALRGMKYSLGNYHPNVAAILGNFGNLQKEMGDLDAAYDTYQEVLGIESYRLGLSHPDVCITLHNIATIDAARGNNQRALKLYEQVMCLQQKLFGSQHISIAVTAACMGDVYEALGQMKDAFESYEDSLRIKSTFQGQHSLEVARILHKLAKVALKRGDHRLASSYISRAIFVYRLNKIPDDHEWVVDAHRDSADIDASLALTKKMTFEC